jgi:mTERF.
MERYNGTEVCIDFNDEEWRKAKRYIYYATSSSSTKHPLSVEQVVAVLDFLDETFVANRVNHQYQNKNTDIDSVFILKSVPRILRKDPERFIKPTVNFLKELYGPMFSQFVQRRPDLVIASGVGYNGRKKAIPPDHQTLVQVEECFLETNVEVYLEKNLCLSSAELSTLKKKHPSLFEISMKKLHGTVDYLRSVIRMGSEEYCQDDAIIGKIIKANPNILNLSLENIQAKIMFLSDLGFDAGENMRALLKKYPGILGLSLDRNLRPTTTALLEYYTKAMDDESSRKFVKKTIALHPQLLALSPANFAAKISYFDKLDCGDSLGIDMIIRHPKSSLALKLLMAAPSVYSLSLENIQEKVSYLSGLWSTDVSRPTVDRPVEAKQISDFPAVLTLSLEGNLQPTIAFYNRTGYIQDGRTTLPGRYLASSLYNRLLPRWNYFLKFDQKIDEDTEYRSQEVTGRLPLHILAGASDQIFCKRMKYSYEDYMKFKKEAVPILKFSSQFDTWISTGRPIDLDDND